MFVLDFIGVGFVERVYNFEVSVDYCVVKGFECYFVCYVFIDVYVI